MSNIFVLLLIILILIIAISVWRRLTSFHVRRDDTEIWVDEELNKRLDHNRYVIFSDLVIPSVSHKIPSTQIDHVVVSIYGIFCLETKSHQGNIYGGYKSKYWKQYLGNEIYDLYSPFRQNGHHVSSLEDLIGSRLRAPIHSYIVFPSAHKIVLNGSKVNFTFAATIEKIRSHTRQIYSFDDITAISKGLVLASSQNNVLRENHIESVRMYIETHK